MGENISFKHHRGGKTKMTTGSGKDLVLDSGELFIEYPDDGVSKGKCKIKIGDGVTAYEDISYAFGDTSTDPITFTQGTQTTVEAALADATSGAGLDTITGSIKQAVHLCGDGIDTINTVTIPELQANFQAGVDSIYDAVVSKGTTPASKSLSDVVAGVLAIRTIHTTTYTPTERKNNNDMGSDHEYRYVDTTSVPNTNSGTYSFPANDTGGTKDLGETNTYRYVNADNVYTKGKADAPRQEKSCTPSTSAQTVNPDSGYLLSKVNVAAIPNLHTSDSMIVPRWGTNAGASVPATTISTRNPRIDFNNTNRYGNAEMVEVAMPEGYYAWSYGNSSCCIPTETKTVTAGTSATSVTPTDYNSGGKYLKYLKSVTINPTPSQEKTITSSRSAQTVTPDSGKLLSKVTVNKYPDASGTYTASSRGNALDMGATNNLRYVNTNGVPNVNSDTYTYGSGSTGGTVDLGYNNTYRYVNASNVYAKGKADGTTVHTGTYTYGSGSTGGTVDLGSSHTYRYVNADNVYAKGVADGKASAAVVFKQANRHFSSNTSLDDYITNTLGKNCKVYIRFRLTGDDVLIQVAGSTKWSGHVDSEGTFDLGVNQSVRFKQSSEGAANSDTNYYFVAIYG